MEMNVTLKLFSFSFIIYREGLKKFFLGTYNGENTLLSRPKKWSSVRKKYFIFSAFRDLVQKIPL